MKPKIIVGILVTVAFVIFGAISFVDSNVEYTDFAKAEVVKKKVQVKGTWCRDKETQFNAKTGQFVFYMKDDQQREVKVVLDGAKPNNFELAESIVAKGRFKDGYFHASDILTKCPSKYEGNASNVQQTL